MVSKEIIKEKSKHPILQISAKDNLGLDEFEKKIMDMFFQGELSLHEDIYITNERHRMELSNALESLKLVTQSIDSGMPEDFFSIDLMNAYEALGRIIGENVEEDLVNMIFKEFCMGK